MVDVNTNQAEANIKKTVENSATEFCGLDVGTMNFVSAKKDSNGTIATKFIRDAFIDLPVEARQMLKLSSVSFVEKDDRVLVVGDDAFKVANLFNREARRPLSKGIISSSEIDALEVLTLLVESVIGKTTKGFRAFSVPAEPIDADMDVIYHEGIFNSIITSLGYNAKAVNEAEAICYSECADNDFTGLTISYGAGQTNIALVYRTMVPMKFSIARGGDWIDERVSKAVGTTASRVAAIKETGFDIMNPTTGDPKDFRVREALALYYKNLIRYTLESIVFQFNQVQDKARLPISLPLVISGGTSLAQGFVPLFKQLFSEGNKLPVEISEIRHAKKPLEAVALGLLTYAQNIQ